MSYFAVALARNEAGWSAEEVDLDEVSDLEALSELLRDMSGDESGPALMLLEEDDEYVAIVRVDGGSGSLEEPRVFLSDRRAVQNSDVAAMLWEEAELEDEVEDDDEDEGTRPVAEPVGDTELLADLGTPGSLLVSLCAEEGRLPADVITAICERAGCEEQLEALRDG